MNRPRIGITTSLEEGRQTLDIRYVEAVEEAGGIPIIVPYFQAAEPARDFAALLDGLIITGGPGITRGLIGELPPELPAVDPRRDQADEWMYHAMNDRPMLGICYGMQFINAMAGGSIYGDAQAQRNAGPHSPERGGGVHQTHITRDSRLQAILGTDSLPTNSYHLQAVASLGEGLRVAAVAEDGLVEALESTDGRLLGLQFHPERMRGPARALFADLIKRASQRP